MSAIFLTFLAIEYNICQESSYGSCLRYVSIWKITRIIIMNMNMTARLFYSSTPTKNLVICAAFIYRVPQKNTLAFWSSLVPNHTTKNTYTVNQGNPSHKMPWLRIRVNWFVWLVERMLRNDPDFLFH